MQGTKSLKTPFIFVLRDFAPAIRHDFLHVENASKILYTSNKRPVTVVCSGDAMHPTAQNFQQASQW